jgi:hypothetical protein
MQNLNWKWKKLFDKIESYCNPRKNEVLESHRFWVTNPDECTSFDSFLTEFWKHVESCNFDTQTERMLRDKIGFSSNGKQQELLLREEILNFEKAIKICWAYEQSNKHVKEVCNTNDQPIHIVEKTYSSYSHSGTRISINHQW